MDLLGINKYILIVAGVLLVSSFGLNYWQYKINESKTTEIAQLTTVNKMNVEAIKELTKSQAEAQSKVIELSKKNGELAAKAGAARAQLDTYRSRLAELTIKKPGLIQLQTNKKWEESQEKLRQMTK